MFGLTPYNRRNSGVMRKPMDLFNMDSIFENFFNDFHFPTFYNNSGQMKVDIKNNEKEYIIEAELPGFNKEDIKVELNNDMLTISVERNEHISEERENYIRRERTYGSMSRSFYLENVKEDGITARFENGVLSITLPKVNINADKNKRIIDIN
ncbi:MAG: hypothetical protein PWQ67_1055 [Clostridia bacterium]|jgi:HSP20 family protein|nr:hypothetical protein [Clostridia bacterium]MDN5322601.1 hypothetical protein [Clostridia bacterium]